MDVSKVYVLVRYETSFIHAPARGATGFDCKQVFRCRVSIHAPARGATKLIFLMFVVLLVSIHAPARGATKYTRSLAPIGIRFNPRTYKRCDHWLITELGHESGVRVPKMAQTLKISGLQKETEKTVSITHHFLDGQKVSLKKKCTYQRILAKKLTCRQY